MGATDSLTELYGAVRTRLLTYTDGGAAPNTINAAVSGRIYNEAPPETLSPATQAMPYVLLTIDGNPPDTEKDRARVEFQVEVQIINRPRTTIAATRRIADLAWKALAGYQVGNATDGLISMRTPPLPQTLPPGGGDADREVVQIVITANGYAYWKALATVIP